MDGVNQQLKKEADAAKSEQLTATEQLSKGEQCDLLTEHYDQLIGREKCKYEQLSAELEARSESVNGLTSEVNRLRESSQSEIAVLNEKLCGLELVAAKVSSLTQQLEEAINSEAQGRQEISKLNRIIEDLKRETNQQIEAMCQEREEFAGRVKRHDEERAKEFEIQLELMAAQRSEFEDEAIRCRQKVQDAQEDVRIAERRIASVTQDLRRQLRCERRRADKLQERLGELVADGSSVSLTAKNDANNTSVDTDNCSVSSWSLMSGQNETNCNGNRPSTVFIKQIESICNQRI